MDEYKPNIKIELVSLWSDTEVRLVQVIKLVVSRKFHQKAEVHFFEVDKLIKNLEENQNDIEANYESLFQKLTKREQEILINVARGETSIEISEKLYISGHTVKNHRKNIKLKLNLVDTIDYSKFLRWVAVNIRV